MTPMRMLFDTHAGQDDADWRDVNLANWNDRVPIHMASAFYDLDSFRAGADTLRPFEAGEAGDVRDKRLVHLQCHFGLDTLSWARARRAGQRAGLLPAGDTGGRLARRRGGH